MVDLSTSGVVSAALRALCLCRECALWTSKVKAEAVSVKNQLQLRTGCAPAQKNAEAELSQWAGLSLSVAYYVSYIMLWELANIRGQLDSGIVAVHWRTWKNKTCVWTASVLSAGIIRLKTKRCVWHGSGCLRDHSLVPLFQCRTMPFWPLNMLVDRLFVVSDRGALCDKLVWKAPLKTCVL